MGKQWATMGELMYDNKTKGNIRYHVQDLVYDLNTKKYLHGGKSDSDRGSEYNVE